MQYLSAVALILNFGGTVLAATAFGEHVGGGYDNKNGKRIYLASFLSPFRFYSGMTLLGVGFLLQLLLEIIRVQ